MAEHNPSVFSHNFIYHMCYGGAGGGQRGRKKKHHSPDNSPIKQGEYEIKYNGSPSNKMVYPCPEVSF